jgi:hypothetical protein
MNPRPKRILFWAMAFVALLACFIVWQQEHRWMEHMKTHVELVPRYPPCNQPEPPPCKL